MDSKLRMLFLLTMITIFSITNILVLAESDSQAEVLYQKGQELFESNNFQEADYYFDKALEIDPNHVKALVGKGLVHQALGGDSEALDYFIKAFELDPYLATSGNISSTVEVFYSKGVQALELKNYEEAISYFDKVLEIDQNHISALIDKGSSLVSLGKKYEGLVYYDKVLKIMPELDLVKKYLAVTTSTLYTPIEGELNIIVRNSQGDLVAFLRTNYIEILDHKVAYDYLDGQPEKTLTQNNQKFNTISIHKSKIDEEIMDSQSYYLTIKNVPFPILRSFTSSYITEIGDKVDFYYTIYKPIE